MTGFEERLSEVQFTSNSTVLKTTTNYAMCQINVETPELDYGAPVPHCRTASLCTADECQTTGLCGARVTNFYPSRLVMFLLLK